MQVHMAWVEFCFFLKLLLDFSFVLEMTANLPTVDASSKTANLDLERT